MVPCVLATVALTGCVAPLAHTYFVPNPQDGKPMQSSSCGFLSNNENSLQRKYGDLTVSVTPGYDSKGSLFVSFFVLYPSSDVSLDGGKIVVRETSRNKVLAANNIKVTRYGPDRSHPYTLATILSFPETALDIDTISVSVDIGALIVGGQQIELAPFRFKEQTSTDLFYASINC